MSESPSETEIQGMLGVRSTLSRWRDSQFEEQASEPMSNLQPAGGLLQMCENRRRTVPAGDREGDNGMTDVPTSAEAMGILDMIVEERSIHPEDYRWPVTEFQEVVEDLRPRGDVFGESLIRIVEEDLSPGEDYGETLTWTSSPY